MISENFLYLKLSIIQFLLKRNLIFFNKENEITFSLLSNDKQVTIQNTIGITEENLYFYGLFPIRYKFLSKEKIRIICNYINELSSVFSTYLKFDDCDEISLFVVKYNLTIKNLNLIDDNFWDAQIKIQISNISNIINFLYFDLPKSNYYNYNDKDFDSEGLKNFLIKCCNDYTKAIQIIERNKEEINEEKLKINFQTMSKFQLEKELDKELENWNKGIKHENILKEITECLKRFE